MTENEKKMEKSSPGWRRFAIAGGSGVALGVLVVAANGILGGPIQFNVKPPEPNTFQVDISGIDTRSSEFVKIGEVISMTELVPPPPDPNAPPDAPPPPYVVPTPGNTTFQPVTLERTYKGTDDLFNWRMRIESGAKDPRDVSITIMDPLHHPIRHVTLMGAFPSGWEMPSVGPDGQPSVERIVFTAAQVRED